MRLILLSIVLTTAGMANAAETPECRIRVLRPVDDDIGNHWKAGDLVPADILRREGGASSYCAHGGSCTPALADGRPAVRLLNCRPGKSLGSGDYLLDYVPSEERADGLRRAPRPRRVGIALSALGFSNAATASWSRDYAQNPSSPAGRLVARALAGSVSAVRDMKAKLP